MEAKGWNILIPGERHGGTRAGARGRAFALAPPMAFALSQPKDAG